MLVKAKLAFESIIAFFTAKWSFCSMSKFHMYVQRCLSIRTFITMNTFKSFIVYIHMFSQGLFYFKGLITKGTWNFSIFQMGHKMLVQSLFWAENLITIFTFQSFTMFIFLVRIKWNLCRQSAPTFITLKFLFSSTMVRNIWVFSPLIPSKWEKNKLVLPS